MIMPSLSSSARAALMARLEDLQAQRVQTAIESIPPGGSGDAADHAGNVEALVRLGELDARIAALQVQLQAPDADPSRPRPPRSAAWSPCASRAMRRPRIT